MRTAPFSTLGAVSDSEPVDLDQNVSSGDAESEGMDDNSEGTSGRVELSDDLSLFEKVERVIEIPPGEMHWDDAIWLCPDLVRGCCKTMTSNGLRQASLLLDRLVEEKRKMNKRRSDEERPMVIDKTVFDYILFGWAKLASKHPDAPLKMREMINVAIEEAKYDEKTNQRHKKFLSNKDKNEQSSEEVFESDSSERRAPLLSEPDVQLFNTYLRGLAEASKMDPSLASDAERLLDEMNYLSISRGWHTKPNSRSYTEVIVAYSQSRGNPQAGKDADRVFHAMKVAHAEALSAYESQFGEPYNLDGQNNKYKIVTPDKILYTALIQVHAHSPAPKSKERAEELLMEMMEHDHMIVDAVAVAATINGWGQQAKLMHNPKKRAEAAEKAEELLWMYVDSFPNEVIQEIADSDEDTNAQTTDADSMDNEEVEEEQSPSVVHPKIPIEIFNAALQAWARSDTKEAGPRAEAILHRMMEDPRIEPDLASFNIVINAWSRFFKYDVESHLKAEQVMDFMKESVENDILDPKCTPDAHTYVTVMTAWAKSSDDNRTKRCRDLLNDMLKLYEEGDTAMKPSTHAFTAVLTAATKTSSVLSSSASPEVESETTDDLDETFHAFDDVEDPYPIAYATYQEMFDNELGLNLKPDHLVFSSMLQVVANHTEISSTERKHMTDRIFRDACDAGQVSAHVVRALQGACNGMADHLARLFHSPKLAQKIVSVDELPDNWTRYVPKHNRFRTVAKQNHGWKGKKARTDNRKKHRRRERRDKAE